MATAITSDQRIEVDTSFKVSAGPGAGKTHWLASHIINVMSKSRRLGVTRKIACISYTNVGAETIISRLPKGTLHIVEVCTIHSFLYSYVLKPFLHFDANFFKINTDNLRIEPPNAFLTKGYAMEVLSENGKAWISPEIFMAGISNCHWCHSGDKTEFKPRKLKKVIENGKYYFVPNSLYGAYKAKRWRQGYISYDDIIYLSKELLNRHPEIFNFLKAQFPYFFVDEFQDSIPDIVDFVRKMGECGVTVGVIGDKAQTIYDFIGASVEMFESFTVPDMIEYEIRGNRRSTSSIVDLLNVIRPDFLQCPIDTGVGDKPMLLIGDKLKAYNKAIMLCGTNDIHTLAYKNIIANSMRYGTDCGLSNNNLLNEGFDDSSADRARVVRALLKATEFAYQNNLREAWLQLDIVDEYRSNTVGHLRKLLKNRPSFLNEPLYNFYSFIVNELGVNISGFREGKNKNFYMRHTYLNLAICMDVADSDGIHKTIHRAKGEEYDNVMVVLGRGSLDVLLNPDLEHESAHRVYYVAMSRARKNLFINIESVDDEQKRRLSRLPIRIDDSK